MTIRTEIFYKGFEKGMKLLDHIRNNEREIYEFENEEKELINTATYLVEQDRIQDGIKMLKYTAARFPESSKVYRHLGEVYELNGNRKLSTRSYEMARRLEES